MEKTSKENIVMCLCAGGVSELHPGFTDKWRKALHMWDQRLYAYLHHQAGSY